MKNETTQTEQTFPVGKPREEERSSAYLVTIAGVRLGEMFRLAKAATIVGRSEDADLRLGDDGVSRRHAVLLAGSGPTVTLEDLDSVNGTYRNGTRVVEPVDLADGDKISMGGTTILKFTYQDALDEQFNRRLYDSVVKDDLTGLYNRRYFDDRLDAELTFASRHDAPLALLILDIDHFKRINDEHGHPIGDAALRAVAHRLASTIRGEDVLARFGGEEFAILCRDTDALQAVTLAERLRLAVAREVFAAGR